MNAPVLAKKDLALSLKDTPSLIEVLFPAQKVSVESQKERKAVQSQTLVSLASYWKGRKPLSLVRACVLGALLPVTDDREGDLRIFELLMGMSDDQVQDRFDSPISIEDIVTWGSNAQQAALLDHLDNPSLIAPKKLPKGLRADLMVSVLIRMPYGQRVSKIKRAEEIPEEALTGKHMAEVNAHLGTTATSLADLLNQLGKLRFGHRPVIADTFSGGGSIPFEAARLGCDVVASDLNPIACMLTWGALEFLGSTRDEMNQFNIVRRNIIDAVDKSMIASGFEHSETGDRAKIYLYCVEAYHRPSGWRIPLSPSWVLHEGTKTIVTLVPNLNNKRFDFAVKANASAAEYAIAIEGSLQGGSIVFFDGVSDVKISLADIRGDSVRKKGVSGTNNLRTWSKSDVSPADEDIYGERLCAIRWTDKESGSDYFLPPTRFDEDTEVKLNAYVRQHLAHWQRAGYVPDMPIEPGAKTDEPIRTRGWTYWHHLFNPRQLYLFAAMQEQISTITDERAKAGMMFILGKALNRGSRLSRWQPHRATSGDVFYNMALNTLYNYGCRAFPYFKNIFEEDFSGQYEKAGNSTISCQPAGSQDLQADIFITDPPYADAVNYHEITEFFIAWFRKSPPAVFREWTWDSRRPLAIKGLGDEFRLNMVSAYAAMADRMPPNGLQIVMFTHQDAGVWADMAQIFWGAGLQVMAAWYIATETTSELKKGGYVQGTVILVLRKRNTAEIGFKDEVVQEVKTEVAEQIDTMMGLNQSLKGHGRVESLFEDADLQMAGYAAALRVLTRYSVIDGVDMTKEALRPRSKVERSLVGEIIDFAVQIANEHMVPDGMEASVWGHLTGAERFFYRMMDVETTGSRKLDNYQNFAKAFRVTDYAALMSSVEASKARLKAARQFKKGGFEGSEFAGSKTRAVLYAIWQIEREVDGDQVISELRELVPNYLNSREDILALSAFITKKRAGVDEPEARAASILEGLIRHERL